MIKTALVLGFRRGVPQSHGHHSERLSQEPVKELPPGGPVGRRPREDRRALDRRAAALGDPPGARALDGAERRLVDGLLQRQCPTRRPGRRECSLPQRLFRQDRGGVVVGAVVAWNGRSGPIQYTVSCAEQARDLGLHAEVLDAAAAAALDPGARMDVAGAVHFAQDCNLVPDRLIAGLERRLAGQAVQVVWNSEAIGWQIDSGKRIRAIKLSASREIEADEFVLAAGSWSSAGSRSRRAVPDQARRVLRPISPDSTRCLVIRSGARRLTSRTARH